MAPRIHVGPEPESLFTEAVEEAGAVLAADPTEAEAIVWLTGEPGGLVSVLHPGVRWVQLSSAGVEQWLADDVIDADRVWTSAAGAYGETVADHAVALALAGRRRLQECARADSWSRSLEGRPLFGCTVAVVGAGAIGRAVIRLLAPWDCRIVAVTRSGRDVEEADSSLPASALEEVWPQADVVVLAAPATDATRHLVGAPELARFRSDAVLVNVARGSLIDTDALVEALAAERLGCAALDVTDPEPLPDGHPLWDEQRALITPHVANTDDIRRRTLANFTRENIRRFAAGKELRGRIDPARGY